MGITLTRHLRRVASSARIYTNGELNEFAQATLDALEELDDAKADKTEVTDVLTFFTASGLYIDEDGDVAQQ